MKKQELKKDTLASLNATLKYEIQSLDLANFHSVSAFSELIEINCKHRKNCECCPGYYLSTSVY